MARRVRPPARPGATSSSAADPGTCHRSAAPAIAPIARLAGRLPLPAGRRGWLTAAALVGAALVALAGVASPAAAAHRPDAPAAGGAATAASAGASIADWGAGPASLDFVDLAWKGGLVLVLLFITLRILGRMQTGGPARSGHLAVLESRTLASKASLHLVAVGERRLVVGLTPGGMVALAELDADELAEVAVPDGAERAIPTSTPSGPRMAGTVLVGQLPGPLASATTAVDAVADRFASLLGKARAR